MIDGNIPAGCQVCYNGESNNLRGTFLNKFNKYDREIYDDVRGFRLNYLDLRWRNTCNSACVYCGPELSSRIAAEQGIEIRSDTSTIDATKRFITDNIQDIKHIYLAGGEPLLIRENEWLLSLLLDKKIYPTILVNTNLSQINNRVFDLLCEFSEVNWLISGEHVGEHYEYIRYGSSWGQFDSNINRLLELTVPLGHRYEFNMVYFALNLQGFWQYLDWLKNKNIPDMLVHPAWISNGNPDPFDPRRMPEKYQRPALDEIDQRLKNGDRWDVELAQYLLNCWQQPEKRPNPIWSWRSKMANLDQTRGIDSKRLWPELWDMFNELVTNWNKDESK